MLEYYTEMDIYNLSNTASINTLISKLKFLETLHCRNILSYEEIEKEKKITTHNFRKLLNKVHTIPVPNKIVTKKNKFLDVL
jgi:hypothetical protein